MSNIPLRLMLALGLALVSVIYGQDAKPASPPSEAPWITKTFDVKYIDPEEVRSVFASQSHVMEANRELRLLTAHGTPTFLKEVEDTVKRLDVAPPPPPDLEITVYLLAGAVQVPAGKALPPELSALAKELPAKLADLQMFRVRAGQPGEETNTPVEGATAVTLTRIRLDSTAVNPGPKGDVVSVNGLKVWINIPADPAATASAAKSPKNDPDVSADIDVAPNEAVVVAKVGVDKPLAVVVRVGVVK